VPEKAQMARVSADPLVRPEHAVGDKTVDTRNFTLVSYSATQEQTINWAVIHPGKSTLEAL